MKKYIVWILFLTGITSLVFSSGTEEKQLDIYYTSSLNGNFDGCDCKGNPRSGLVKRAVYLRGIDKNKSILLEAGDIFDVYPDELLSNFILESYLELGYDAIVIGDQEFSNGTDYLQNNIFQYPLISNNMSFLSGNGNPDKKSAYPLIISRGGFDIGIISVTDPDAFRFYPDDITESIEVADPSILVPELLDQREVIKADLRVLLYHGSLVNARKLAKENPSLNIIIAGHEQQILDGEMVGDTVIVSPGAEGNMLGYLKVSSIGKKLIFENRFITFDYLTDPDDPAIRGKIDEYNRVMTEKLKTN